MSRRIGVPPYRVLGVLVDGLAERLPLRDRRRLMTLLKDQPPRTLQ